MHRSLNFFTRQTVLLLIAVILAACAAPSTPTPQPPPTGTPSTASEVRSASSIFRDATYCTAGNTALKMDVYYPRDIGERPMPLVVHIHGGGFVGGTRNTGFIEYQELLAHRFVVATIEYRLAPTFKWPAMVLDGKCAIRHLRANAATYGIDPERIGVWGHSAGGTISAMIGLSDASAGLDIGEYAETSSRVQAVATLSGATYMPGRYSAGNAGNMERIFGVTSVEDPALVRASPITYVSPDDPPFLIIHGEKDELVPATQSKLLFARLLEARVPSKLVLVENASHMFGPSGGIPEPSRPEITGMIADFFQATLR